jgi:hypothetical protein
LVVFVGGGGKAFVVGEDDEFVDDEFEEGEGFDLVDVVFADDGFGLGLGQADLVEDVGGGEVSEPEPDGLYLLFNLFIRHYIYLLCFYPTEDQEA